eukprot:9068458-Heterocapsa_arctica.AAC.1
MATRSTQQTIMIGDFGAMTGKSSSPHVRACLKTLQKLGAVYDCPWLTSKLEPSELVENVWGRMLAA